MDDVMTDFLPHYIDCYNSIFGELVAVEDVTEQDLRVIANPSTEHYVFNIFTLPEFYFNIPPKGDTLHSIIGELGQIANIIIVTDPFVRDVDKRLDIMGQKKRWIDKYLGDIIDINSQVIFTDQKGWIKGDIIVDDNPTHISNFLETNKDGAGIMFPTFLNGLQQLADDRVLRPKEGCPEAVWEEILGLVYKYIENNMS